MAEEIELKLALGADGARALAEHPRLAGQPARRETLTNTYYDTPTGDLEAARVALRIRRTPERWLQTLKTAGQGSGGLSARGEWEWTITGPTLDLAGLETLAPMQTLGRDVLTALEPRFTTDFERTSWLLESGEASVEVALDRGEILAGERRAAIDELELELKRGTPEALWTLAETFAAEVPLRPANLSKAARGAALRDAHWPLPPPATLHDATPAGRFDAAIAALDALADSGDAAFLARARDALQMLADDDALDAAIREPAVSLAAALGEPDWLDRDFGRHSLALLAALHRA
ncbi:MULTISPECIES: CYTH domain-containing protein [unclassified Modicisalibacter]|uniref:CYTH domain-containing protein n=1 Tax=unclassified Modicisalibacter TaxID=2679913 RepID=UPI001CD022AA|nr:MULTISPECIES: CYTH domain-containing protein [unclassified Modicisalibacter]MBZ9559463.1 CYTH domain-containing protein [Modicisalibacter sp. R2A 31.J]MBZ9576371.1 CYTH domain-containing protein [Modicisalibacter sp. MOD 31.J]